MLVKNTFQTLFRVSDTGLELLADFVTKGEAEEWAAANQVLSYLVIETAVMHQVKITQQITPARALRMTGEIDQESQGKDPLKPRSGPIVNARTASPGQSTASASQSEANFNAAAEQQAAADRKKRMAILEQMFEDVQQQIEQLKTDQS